jgi:hypothetical protein
MVDARFARRQATLSCIIVRNIAFYYSGWVNGDARPPLKDDSEVGRTINSNFIDVAVLEWSKLFVDWEAKHHWRRFIQNTEARTAFRTALLAAIGLDLAGWEKYHQDVKTYRDHFIAHLDDDDDMIPPRQRVALDSTVFFYQHLVNHAPTGAIVGRLPRDLRAYYDDCRDLADTYHATYD